MPFWWNQNETEQYLHGHVLNTQMFCSDWGLHLSRPDLFCLFISLIVLTVRIKEETLELKGNTF